MGNNNLLLLPDAAASIPALHTHRSGVDVLKRASCDVWFFWALAQFNLFDGAPRPGPTGADFGRWIDSFLAWLKSGAGNKRKRTIAACLLRCYNDQIKVEGAGDLWLEYGGLDDTNRVGVRRVLEHIRYF